MFGLELKRNFWNPVTFQRASPAAEAEWVYNLVDSSYTDMYQNYEDPAPGGLRRFVLSDTQTMDGPPWNPPFFFDKGYTFDGAVTMTVDPATTKELVQEIVINGYREGHYGVLFPVHQYPALKVFLQGGPTGTFPVNWNGWSTILEEIYITSGATVPAPLVAHLPDFNAAPFKDSLLRFSLEDLTDTTISSIAPLTALISLSVIRSNMSSVSLVNDNLNSFVLHNFPNLTAIDMTQLPNLAAINLRTSPLVTTLSVVDNTLIETIIITSMSGLISIDATDCSLLTAIVMVDCVNLRDLFAEGSGLTESYIDELLVRINNNGLEDGTIDLRVAGGTAPTATGLTAKTALELRGYTVLVNP